MIYYLIGVLYLSTKQSMAYPQYLTMGIVGEENIYLHPQGSWLDVKNQLTKTGEQEKSVQMLLILSFKWHGKLHKEMTAQRKS